MRNLYRRYLSAVPRWARLTLRAILAAFILFVIIDAIFPVKTSVEYSCQILANDSTLLHSFLTSDDKWRMETSPEDVNPLFIRTLIMKEDRWFRWHPGINPVSVARALWQNISKGERFSGASTITMQVVRLLEPRKRTYFNKIIEMFRALQLEFHLSKDEILKLYINLLPYGGNIEGVRAASFLYFGQEPQALSQAQIVTLAVIPNNPYNLRLGIHNERIVGERNKWLRRLSGKGLFKQGELSDALSEPLSAFRREAPKDLPHLSIRLHNAAGYGTTVYTYIDRQLQSNVEEILRTEINPCRSLGITNAAVVVVDNRSHGILAYAGSAGFSETMFSGQVDGVAALRSPGSALKPFLYALAIDRGLITAKTMLTDIPMNFNGYRPQNFDQTFRGLLTAGDALALSLNVPAVELANRMGADFFNSELARAGFHWIEKKRKSLGLSVVLGGCGVSLLEMSRLFSSFANQGINFPLRFSKSEISGHVDTLVSPEAAWMVTEILTGLKRPDLPTNFDNAVHLPHIAWKTGTSYGRRDAWSIGYNPEYTVGVWVGNFDGEGVPELAGSDFAAPVLFKVFTVLTYNKSSTWFRKPAKIDFRLVCAESGLPPSDFCTNMVMEDYIPGVSPNRKCTHLRTVFTDEQGAVSYCRDCLPPTGYRTALYPDLPPTLIAFYEQEHIPYLKIPPHNPACTKVFRQEGPLITSLTDGKEYIIYDGSKQQLLLTCAAGADVNKVYWYINDKFYKQAAPSEKVFFTPEPGKIKISCSDDKARNSDIRITVSEF
ncbi:MAG TPA: penicillin-binding protein 1C [Bacteroidales bacterium]|nr:penicillin-binding protein 1C [Bacteroidales bacterium]